MSTHLANTHPSADDLSAYLDHEVDARALGALEAHLEGCPSCRARLAALAQTVGAVRALGPIAAPPAVRAAVYDRLRRERRWPDRWRRRLPAPLGGPTWRLAAAAVAVLLVGLFAANRWQQAVPGDEVGIALPRLGPGAPSAPGRGPAVPGPQPAVQTVGSGAGPAPVIRQVVRQASVTLLVARLADASAALVRIAEQGGGFVAASSTDRQRGESRYVLRIPAPRFHRALEEVEALGQVEQREVRGEDVSEQLVDLRARLRTLERHEQQLLALMDRAARVSDLLAIEQELARVRGEIETLAGRLRVLGERVDFATIEVTVRERPGGVPVRRWDPGATLTKVRQAFLGTVRQVLAATEWVLVVLGAVTPLAVLGLGGWGLRRWLRRGPSPG